MKAKEWKADDTTDRNGGIAQRFGNPNYDAMNSYGDDYNPGVIPGVGLVTRSGYKEKDLTDNNIHAIKGDFAAHIKPWADDKEIILQHKIGMGNTIYQGASRYMLKNFIMQQTRVEFKGKNFLVRGYMSTEDAGDSYDMQFAGMNLNRMAKPDVNWYRDYATAYALSQAILGLLPDNAANYARTFADTNVSPGLPLTPYVDPNNPSANTLPRFEVGTPQVRQPHRQLLRDGAGGRRVLGRAGVRRAAGAGRRARGRRPRRHHRRREGRVQPRHRHGDDHGAGGRGRRDDDGDQGRHGRGAGAARRGRAGQRPAARGEAQGRAGEVGARPHQDRERVGDARHPPDRRHDARPDVQGLPGHRLLQHRLEPRRDPGHARRARRLPRQRHRHGRLLLQLQGPDPIDRGHRHRWHRLPGARDDNGRGAGGRRCNRPSRDIWMSISTAWKAPALVASAGKDLGRRAREITRTVDPVLLKRANSYLYTKETRSSFAIEREEIEPGQKMERFLDQLAEIGARPIDNEAALTEVQRGIVDSRYVQAGFRGPGALEVYVGETLEFREKIHHVGARSASTPALMAAWARMRSVEGPGGAVVEAACRSFSFVFIHPFGDGNGRIHRLLLHNVLAIRRYLPPRLIVPISAVLLSNPDSYDYALESFSRRVLPLVEYKLDADGNLTVPDATELGGSNLGPRPGRPHRVIPAREPCSLVSAVPLSSLRERSPWRLRAE